MDNLLGFKYGRGKVRATGDKSFSPHTIHSPPCELYYYYFTGWWTTMNEQKPGLKRGGMFSPGFCIYGDVILLCFLRLLYIKRR